MGELFYVFFRYTTKPTQGYSYIIPKVGTTTIWIHLKESSKENFLQHITTHLELGIIGEFNNSNYYENNKSIKI